MRAHRRAATLVEVLVVVAVLAAMLGLLLPAVQKVRGAAARTASMNNLRQLVLATQGFVAKEGRLPALDGGVHLANLPYLDGGAGFGESVPWGALPDLPVFRSPLDPSGRPRVVGAPVDPVTGRVGEPRLPTHRCSYPANGAVFADRRKFPEGVPDGTSNTVGFAEHYSICNGVVFYWNQPLSMASNVRRAAFADPGLIVTPVGNYGVGDVRPVTAGSPPTSRASDPGQTFQVAPPERECAVRIAQTPHPEGMLVGLLDGSTRAVRPGIAESAYWAAVTPAGGEVAGLD